MGVEMAIISAAVIGAATTAYQSKQQQKIADEQQARLDAERKRKEKEAERIARATKPEQESAKSIQYGAGDSGDMGSVEDFIVQKPIAKVGGVTGTSGLGFKI